MPSFMLTKSQLSVFPKIIAVYGKRHLIFLFTLLQPDCGGFPVVLACRRGRFPTGSVGAVACGSGDGGKPQTCRRGKSIIAHL